MLRRVAEGVSRMLRNEPELTRIEVIDGLRPRPKEGRRRGERGDLGEREAGDPGWTWAAQEAIVEKVFEGRWVGAA
jgi:hypothetical protein